MTTKKENIMEIRPKLLINSELLLEKQNKQ